MKAAVLKAFGAPLVVETLPDPVIGTGEVIVDVAAAPVLSYANEIFSGARRYLLNLPVVPGTGAIGRVHAVGPDATHLVAGDWVFCDPTVRSRDDALSPDITHLGLTARSEGGLRLQTYFRHGSFAERILIPTENAIRIGALDAADAPRWCALNTLLAPYGGLLAAKVQAGETVLISGATGTFGSAAIAVALAMGAGSVIAPGRNEKVLEALAHRFGPRLRTVELLGNEEEDRERMRQAAPGPIDCVLDVLPAAAGPTPVRAAAMTVRPYGRIVLIGGVGTQGGPGLELPYPWIVQNCVTIGGNWRYTPEAVVGLIRLIRSGLLRLEAFNITSFALDDVNEAVAHAAADAGPFRLTVVQP